MNSYANALATSAIQRPIAMQQQRPTAGSSSPLVHPAEVEQAIQKVTKSATLQASREGPARRPPVRGTSDSDSKLKVGPTLFHMQLTNLHPDTDIKAISEYITEKDPSIVPVEVKDTSSEGWETKRFLVSFNFSAYEKVMTSSFWPSKIYFKQWYIARPKKESPTTTSHGYTTW